jgi:N-acetylmuramoyl-L-alanine amidase
MTLQEQANLTFLALVIWREARGEIKDGQTGVAYVILNRVLNPGWWGNNVTSVLFQKWQFSSMTNPKDRQLTTWPREDDIAWQNCLNTANEVLSGRAKNIYPDADSYHDISISPPGWAVTAHYCGQIGRLKFYNIKDKK